MCGIAGYFLKEKILKDNIKTMTKCLSHRGPDGEGYFIEDNVALGHKRLSIIDLKTGDQPIFNEDKSVVVIFNGEIYNFKELKSELQSKGHKFYTNSDTEVLVHLYEGNGELFADKLNGIFSFALFDKKNQKLILARDPLGVKPLYYSTSSNGVIFASELKSLLKFEGFSPTFDETSLPLYLQFEYYPAPLTPYKEIKKLLPGHTLSCNKEGDCEVKRYNFWKFENFENESEKVLAERVREEIVASVKRQLLSDVPLGVFLSGGVDSTSVTCAMKEAGAEIFSFSIGFEDKDFDESSYAKIVAEHLKTTHFEKIFSEKDLIEEIDFILSNLDEPLADPSIFPTALLSKFAREKVKVALGGDGGDELFCGYPTYIIHKFFPLYSIAPKTIRKAILNFLDKMLPVSEGNLTFPYKMRKFLDGAEKEMPERHFAFMGAFNRERLKKLMPDAELDFSQLNWIEPPPMKDRVTTAQWLDLHTYLMEDVLQKVDRMSMLSSLEVRVPLLDKEVVKLAFSIPPSLKLKGFRLKHLLKKSFEKDLPKGFFERKKRGFAIPISRWIKKNLKNYVIETLSNNIFKDLSLNRNFINEILNDHFSNKKDNRKLIWTLFVLAKTIERSKYEV